MATMHPGWLRKVERAPAKPGPKPRRAADGPVSLPGDDGFGRAFAALTTHQRTVCRLRCQGLNNGEAAHELGISLSTMKNHVWIIFAALGVGSGYALCYRLGRADAEREMAMRAQQGTTRVCLAEEAW